MAESKNRLRMDAIGGYFELELKRGEHYHKDAIRLNTARNCFEYILLARKYRKVYIPYYTCEVMLQPLKRQQVDYEFYSIDWNLEPTEIFKLQEGEAFLYTNYFGLKQDCVERLAEVYGSRLIVDNAQAFFAPRVRGIDTFYSPRKFFGVPDGGYLYTDRILDVDFQRDESWNRMAHLLIRADKTAESGYMIFRENEDKLDNAQIMKMSYISEKLMCAIDYLTVAEIRRRNFRYLQRVLGQMNSINFNLDKEDVPLVYPFLSDSKKELRQKLSMNRIFLATYWPNVIKWQCCEHAIESIYSKTILPLPIDQRNNLENVEKIKNIILQ